PVADERCILRDLVQFGRHLTQSGPLESLRNPSLKCRTSRNNLSSVELLVHGARLSPTEPGVGQESGERRRARCSRCREARAASSAQDVWPQRQTPAPPHGCLTSGRATNEQGVLGSRGQVPPTAFASIPRGAGAARNRLSDEVRGERLIVAV